MQPEPREATPLDVRLDTEGSNHSSARPDGTGLPEGEMTSPPRRRTESVRAFPIIPLLQHRTDHVVVETTGRMIAETDNPIRIVHRDSAPWFFIPIADVDDHVLEPGGHAVMRPDEGEAQFLHVVVNGDRRIDAAWQYLTPHTAYQDLVGHVAFHVGRVDACFLNGERVRTAAGHEPFGGWVTSRITGLVTPANRIDLRTHEDQV